MDVEPKIEVVTPQIIHLFIGFCIKHHPFWGAPIFGNTHMLGWSPPISQSAPGFLDI